jgi:TIR domain
MSAREPSVFISHKHSDRKIATALRKFIYSQAHREVTVFQSSAADAEGTALGRVLSTELKEALWKTGIVILIYTTDDQDWQWCMWECGVATNPASPDTRIIVLQCSVNTPTVFHDSVRVNVRGQEDLFKFSKAFFTDPAFFPGLGRALAPKLSPGGDEVRNVGLALHAALGAALPRGGVAEWAAQPLLQLQLSLDVVEKLKLEADATKDPAIAVADVTVVSSLDPQAKQVIGIAELAPGTKLSGLAMRWAESVPGASLDWVRDIESQLRRAARGVIPTIRWSYLREIGGSARYAPLLSRVRRIPNLESEHFDVNLVPFDEFAATRVLSRMIPLAEVVCHRVDHVGLSELKVVELSKRLKTERLTRMPFLTDSSCVKLMVHRSMIDAYIASKATEGKIEDLPRLSIADMVNEDPVLKTLFATSFAAVGPNCRLSDVNAIMAANPRIQDVFLTNTGRCDDPIIGWLTNAMMAQRAG